MTTGKYILFDEKVQAAVDRLHDPAHTVMRLLNGNGMPGRMDLQHATFLPRNVHASTVPARYRFELEHYISVEIELMVFWYCPDAGSHEQTVIGLLSHDYRQKLQNEIPYAVPIEREFVAVRFTPFAHKGEIYLDRELYSAFELDNYLVVWRICRRGVG